MINWRKPVVTMMGCSALLACGGGGGGGETFYGGVWRFTGIKVSDSCGAGTENTTSLTLTVNQDGDRVVVDSGSVVLEGTTHADDGFLVVNISSSRVPGCQTETAFEFQDASDGEAAVGFAILSRCSDSPATCTLSYGGTATRTNGRSLETDMDDDLEALTEDFVERSQGLESSEYSGENVSAEAEAKTASLQAENQP